MNGVLILDPNMARTFLAQQGAGGQDDYNEVWDGRIVVPPVPNTEHFRLVSRLTEACSAAIDWDAGDQAVPGGNVTDRDVDWTTNYRNPDVIVALAGGRAVDRGAYFLGGPDLVMEVISPGEDPHAKFDFYAGVGTREVLIVRRDPWYLELFQLAGGALVSAGRSDLANPQLLSSGVIPLTFRLTPGMDRPRIEVTHPPTGRKWSA